MKPIPQEFINELLAQSDIVELIDARLPLKKRGDNFVACCPFHQEKTPSFTVSSRKQFYYCFGCAASGNAIGFLMDHDHLSFVEAVGYLAHQLGREIPDEAITTTKSNQPKTNDYQVMEQVSCFYQQQLRRHPQAMDYLRQRQVTEPWIEKFAVGYAPDNWQALKQFGYSESALLATGLIIKKDGHAYDRFRHRIMFPIRDQRGRVIGFGGRTLDGSEPKYLNSPETDYFHKSRTLYGLYEACQSRSRLEQIIIVEGYMDLLMLTQAGLHNVVATLGTSTTMDHLNRLFSLTSEIIFSFDGDKAGQAAAWRALENSLPLLQDGRTVRFLFLPEGEDPDSWVRKKGADDFKKSIEQALLLPNFLFNRLMGQVNPSTLEGKAKFAKLAVPLLHQIPEGVLKYKLFEQLSQLIKISTEKLKQLTGTAAKKIMTDIQTKRPAVIKRSPMRLAIALLIQHPQLIQVFSEALKEMAQSNLPGTHLLRELTALLTTSPHLKTGCLIEHWRDKPEYLSIKQLAAWDTAIPDQGIEAEFHDILKNLEKQIYEEQIEQLMQKANLNALTAEEKRQLQDLIAQSKFYAE